MTKKASIRSLSSMGRSLSAAGSGCARPKPGKAVYTWLANHVGSRCPAARSISTARLVLANEGIEAAFRGILARHGRPEAVRASLIHAFHAEGRRPPDTPLWKHRLSAISNTDDDLIAGGPLFAEVSDVAEAALLI